MMNRKDPVAFLESFTMAPVCRGLFGLPLTLQNERGSKRGHRSGSGRFPLAPVMRATVIVQEAMPVGLQSFRVGAVEVEGVNP